MKDERDSNKVQAGSWGKMVFYKFSVDVTVTTPSRRQWPQVTPNQKPASPRRAHGFGAVLVPRDEACCLQRSRPAHVGSKNEDRLKVTGRNLHFPALEPSTKFQEHKCPRKACLQVFGTFGVTGICDG